MRTPKINDHYPSRNNFKFSRNLALDRRICLALHTIADLSYRHYRDVIMYCLHGNFARRTFSPISPMCLSLAKILSANFFSTLRSMHYFHTHTHTHTCIYNNKKYERLAKFLASENFVVYGIYIPGVYILEVSVQTNCQR